MNDILPPKRPLSRPPAPRSGAQPVANREPVHAPNTPLLEQPPRPLLIEKPRRRKGKVIAWIIGTVAGVMLLALGVGYIWYTAALSPVNTQSQEKVRIHLASGSSITAIGKTLQDKKLIRSGLAFEIYTRLSGAAAKLQAGSYSLAASESTQQIVAHLTSGAVNELSITFLPGATLAENREVLLEAGYDAVEVDAALEKTYDLPLFSGKPAGADLEGYIYGETYTFKPDVTVEQILQRTFEEFYAVITENKLASGFEKQGLSLYEGITLASIIQREVPGAADQKQVAQVFLKRLETGVSLGSDVTYQYAAKKLGVTPSPQLDSPYNTRLHKGLPPGPIAAPGLSALQAVATPAPGDYLYFLSGDDDKTYFATTNEEHEANIRDHCQVKCSQP